MPPARSNSIPGGSRPATLRARAAAAAMATLLMAPSLLPQSRANQAPAATSAGQAQPEARAPRPDRSRAQNAFQAARQAELASDWKSAFEDYSQAALYAPGNREYSFLKQRARFRLAQQLAGDAERQLLSGNLPGARRSLTEAVQIDPASPVARERLAELPQDLPAGSAREPSGRLAGRPQLTPTPGTHAFDHRGTTRSAYQELGSRFGVTVAFDADLADRAVRFRSPELDFDTALTVLERQTHTFTSVVDAHTIFVAEDSVQKKREYAPEIEKTLLLPASATTDEMNEIVRVVREMTGITRTQLNAATRTLTVRSTEQSVLLAQALVAQIEQARGEVMLEIDILELNRDAAHRLGVTPPSSARTFALSRADIDRLQEAQNNGTLLQILQSLFGSGGALGGLNGSGSAALPPLIAFGGGKTIFLATLPGATANFAQTLSVVRSARRILLRAQDGKPATFFVGDRYPIALALLSSNLAAQATAFSPGVIPGIFPREDTGVGNAPVSLAAADFDADGNQDLAVANQTDGTVTVLLGSGDGKFTTRSDIVTGTAPSALAIADFNGDGFQDIAVTNSADNTVAVLAGSGDGTFSAAVTTPTGNDPVALLALDLDGDSNTDLAVVNQTDGTVSILAGNGDGTFLAGAILPTGSQPAAITSGDYNTDGNGDLAVANTADGTVSILTGNGDGTFSAKTDFPAGVAPAGMTGADFNGDGRQDLVVTNQADNTISLLLGNGDGSFAAPVASGTGNGPVGIIAVDISGEGNPDLVVAAASGDQVSVHLGNGDGTFITPVSVPTGNSPVAVAGGDFNGDGRPDVASANQASNSVTVTLNTSQIPTSSSFSQSAYPASEYVDLGLKVKATPRLHGGDEVTLQLEFELRTLSGSDINGIPVLSNRVIEQTVRLRENQTSVLSGIIETSEARAAVGWPWTADVPGVGYLTSDRSKNSQDTEMLVIITPRDMRLPPRSSSAIYAGRGEPAGGGAPAGPAAPGQPGPAGTQPGAQPGAQPTPGQAPGLPQLPGAAPATPGPPGTPAEPQPVPAPGQTPP